MHLSLEACMAFYGPLFSDLFYSWGHTFTCNTVRAKIKDSDCMKCLCQNDLTEKIYTRYVKAERQLNTTQLETF